MTHNEIPLPASVKMTFRRFRVLVHRLSPDALVVVGCCQFDGLCPWKWTAWDSDVVFTGSQSNWMVPPGIMDAFQSTRMEAQKNSETALFLLLD